MAFSIKKTVSIWPFMRILLVCVLARTAGGAEEWSRFRGANGSGQSEAATIPVEWTAEDYNWQVPLPGIGHSSPVISGDRVVVTSGDPEGATRHVLCLRCSDGSQIWSREFPSLPHHLHARNSYASSTPALDSQHVFFMWATPEAHHLVALDLEDGRTVWKINLGEFKSQHGFATSPIVHRDAVIVANEQLGESFLAAYDCKTGIEKWRCRREGGVQTAYSVPCVFQGEDGVEQLIFHSTAHGISGLNPETGELLWSIDVFNKRCVSSPVVAGGFIFGSSGQGGSGEALVAVRPGNGSTRKPEVAYEIKKSAPYVVTPVVYRDWIFVWHDGGVVSCHDVADGTLRWRQRVGRGFSGSPIRIGANLYGITEDGQVAVLAAEPEFRLLARNELGEPSRATPAVANGRLYLRTESKLISLGGDL
jgi:outer membrane protein assembly factor BamB